MLLFKKFKSLLFLSAVFLLPISVQAEEILAQKENQKQSCDIYDAVYKPHSENRSKYIYELRVEHVPAKPKELSTTSYNVFKVSMKDIKGNVLSILNIPYLCHGGSYPKCFSPITAEQLNYKTELEPFALNEDFSQALIGKREAPYALILPYLGRYMKYFPWDKKEEGIEYFGDHKIHPDSSVPGVWIFSGCEEKATR